MTTHVEFISCEISSVVMMVFSMGKSSGIACYLEQKEKNKKKKMLLQCKWEWL